MSITSIEWTDRVWNPTRGCSLVSEGCRNCYAMRFAHRWPKHYGGLTKSVSGRQIWTGDVRTVPEMLDVPLHWKKPARVFVNSMSDLFHEEIPEEFIGHVFATMAMCPQHTFQILTKRPKEMLDLIGNAEYRWGPFEGQWPLPNVWLGVSVEDQKTADERIPSLLNTPAAVRFVSYEPSLGPVDFGLNIPLTNTDGSKGKPIRVIDYFSSEPKIHWVIVGGESGPGSRVFDVAWARSAVEQCKKFNIPVFVKQLGRIPIDHLEGFPRTDVFLSLNDRKGGDMSEWPEDLRVREYPV